MALKHAVAAENAQVRAKPGHAGYSSYDTIDGEPATFEVAYGSRGLTESADLYLPQGTVIVCPYCESGDIKAIGPPASSNSLDDIHRIIRSVADALIRRLGDKDALAGMSTTGTSSDAAPTTTTESPSSTSVDDGSYIFSGEGTQYSETYHVSHLVYGAKGQAPPSVVLSSCSSDLSSETATDAYVSGSVTLSYDKGVVPLTLNASSGDALTSIDTNAQPNFLNLYSIELDRQWECPTVGDQNGGNVASFTLKPGQDVTLPFWVIVQEAVSNAEPVISPDQAAVLSVEIPFTADQPTTALRVSGPHAADCTNNGLELLPYATLPLQSEGCARAGNTSMPDTAG